MEFIPIVVVVVTVIVVVRLVAGTMDSDRIETYVRERGWELIDRSWDPFGPGWFGEKNARITRSSIATSAVTSTGRT